MKTIVEMRFGSHLYGTNTPSSDLDMKAVHIPAARDILLQKARPAVTEKREKGFGEKNTAEDIDRESYSLQKYLDLVAQGQTVALDMLFAPADTWTAVSGTWAEIIANRHLLVSRQYASFLGYCKQQANKYGIKGSRVAAARAARGVLSVALNLHGTTARLEVIAADIEAQTANTEFMALVDVEMLGPRVIRHWEVCGRKMPYTSSIKSTYEVMQRLVDEYGQRALQAEKNEGIDWKALSHAVRIGHQAIELLKTGHVIFPRPDAAHLLAIKKGELAYQAVAEEIEDLLDAVEPAAEKSGLRDSVDREWIDDFVCEVYGREILQDTLDLAMNRLWKTGETL